MSRRLSRAGGLYPNPFNGAVARIDNWLKAANLRTIIYRLPFNVPEESAGLRHRVYRNNSYAPLLTSVVPPLPPYIQGPWPDREMSREAAFQTLQDLYDDLTCTTRKAFCLLAVQPPPGVDFLHQDKEEEEEVPSHYNTQPICGIVVRLGSRGGESFDQNDLSERSIVTTFMRRKVPEALGKELLRVITLRAAIEAVCWEDIETALKNLAMGGGGYYSLQGGTDSSSTANASTPIVTAVERDRRFVTLASSDLIFCPFFQLASLKELRFQMHWDCELTTVPPVAHDEAAQKECSCHKRYRKDVGNVQENERRLKEKQSGLYQFWMVTAKQLRSLVDHDIERCVPLEGPSEGLRMLGRAVKRDKKRPSPIIQTDPPPRRSRIEV